MILSIKEFNNISNEVYTGTEQAITRFMRNLDSSYSIYVNRISDTSVKINPKAFVIEPALEGDDGILDYFGIKKLHTDLNKLQHGEKDIKDQITNSKKLPQQYKEVALKYLKQYSHYSPGKVTGLQLHPDLIAKIKDNNYPSGFDMGVDKDGYFIHTHRARSKSHETPDKITATEIKFIDSTG